MNLIELLRIVLAWPSCFLVVMLVYRKAINRAITSLLPGAKITLKIGQFVVETSFPEMVQSVTESLVEKALTPDQISLLTALSESRMTRSPFNCSDQATLDIARPLRNAGLIRVPGGGYLQSATEIEITTLGRRVAQAASRKG